ncbi:MAG: radical SAM protein [Chitinophagaceae bacterium]|nr:radical SAM protein [Chitinophagaceae bacterium]
MFAQPLYRTFRRYRTLQTHRISALPIVILMPHSACNCQCVMCDIWKGNKNLKQLTEADIEGLLGSLKAFGTRQVLMSGGEALLNPQFFRLCELLKKQGLRISLLSTGLTLQRHADALVEWVDDIIISLDGDEALHDRIRNIPGAFRKLQDGVAALKSRKPDYPITARTVIHQLNFRHWPAIIDTAKQLGLDQISFLPADTTSQAFNRKDPWNKEKQDEVLIPDADLPVLQSVIDHITVSYAELFASRFIAESVLKLQRIHDFYSAVHGHQPFPYKKCNAPWVSAVVEADGTVRPCFFHEPVGNIRERSLEQILNGEQAYRFRKELDMELNTTCKQCVCYLHLSPTTPV